MASRRAALFKDLLVRINAYGAHSELGLDGYAEFGPPDEGVEQESDDDQHIHEICNLIAEFTATLEAKTRTTLWAPTLPREIATFGAKVCEHLNAMTEPASAQLIKDLRGIADTNPESVAALLMGSQQITTLADAHAEAETDEQSNDENSEEALDRHYSTEVVDRLELIVERASRLSSINLGLRQQLNGDMQRYFAEAHQCYLYGFPVACAVLCRAILETALRQKVPGRFEDFGGRIEGAHERGLLSQPSRVWAYEIKDAGNNAIHQYGRFARGDLALRVEECLLKTREIVEELFSGQAP